jgi:tetratricopeptide (TPR) repeat protein
MFRSFLMAAGLLLSTAAWAQDGRLVPESEFYFDSDQGATQPVIAVEGEGDPLVQQLLEQIESRPGAEAPVAQLAHVAMAGGRPDLGRQLYQRALDSLNFSSTLYRPVLWNYGWDLYRLGDHEAALEQWHALLESRDVDASWMPPTFALVLWTLGRQDEAVQWYAAAVRTEPRLWRSGEGFAELLPQWTDAERALLSDVHRAWAANPPEWR